MATRSMLRPAGCVPAIDVSAVQPAIDWPAVAASGIQVAFVEVGVGNDGANEARAAQVAGALSVGLRVLPYCFAYPLPVDGVHAGRDPVGQVALWLEALRGLGLDPCEPIFVDLEWPREQDWAKWGDSAPFVRGWALAALAELERVTAVVPGVYGSPSFLEAIGCDEEPAFARYPLWIAEWDVAAPIVPTPWDNSSPGWAAWQYSSAGHVNGVPGVVDLSWVRDPRNAPTDTRLRFVTP